MKPTDLIEVKTYKQPSGVIVQLRRFHGGCERLINKQPQQWGTHDTCVAKSRMAEWQNFEERIGSRLL